MYNPEFLPAVSPVITIAQHEDGPVALLGKDLSVMMLDTLFTVGAVQPGHVKEKKELAKNVGQFFYPDLEQFTDRLRLLPIGVINHTRRLYPPYDSGDHTLICYSNDGMQPSVKVEMPLSTECGRMITKGDREVFEATCSKAIWVDGKKPDCSDGLNVAFFDIDLKAPVRMQFSGSGISAWNAFLREHKKARNIARIKGRRLADYVVVMSTENEGTWVRLKFDFEEAPDLSPSAYQPLLAWYRDNLLPGMAIKDAEAQDAAAGDGVGMSAPLTGITPEDAPAVSGADVGTTGGAFVI